MERGLTHRTRMTPKKQIITDLSLSKVCLQTNPGWNADDAEKADHHGSFYFRAKT
jgi:hypothetical protein